MSSEQQDPQLLIQYLLGLLPDAEAERLDELSITDDEVAWRLTAAENDLLDAYVRGELSGEALRRFEAHYLSSQKRRDKVRFAHALALLGDRAGDSPARKPRDLAAARRFLTVPRFAPAWAFAGVAFLLLLPAGFLFLANGRLRQELTRAQSHRATLESRADDLQRQLEQRRSDKAGAPTQPQGAGASGAMIERLQIVSLLLAPQTRGPGRVAALSIPPGTDVVALQLRLESDEFPQYQVTLKTAASDRAIWRSGNLRSAFAGGGKAVTVGLPAALLSPHHYSAELSGVNAGGSAELLTSYVFSVVLR